jgi:hypothetical protein
VSDPIHIISLGAGVQSSTMALMAAKGEITPMPVAAIFADTQAESPLTYQWLNRLIVKLPFPTFRVTAGALRDQFAELKARRTDGSTYLKLSIPAFVEDSSGRGAPLVRGCTADFKLAPIRSRLKALRVVHGAPFAMQWIGISRDEAHRMKDSPDKLVENRWPLIELRMTRTHCLEWLARNGYELPPRSACVFCPFHDDNEWRRLRDDEPESFAQAVEDERSIHAMYDSATRPGSGRPYLHRSLMPLGSVDFTEDTSQLSMFGNECEGMCGV